MGIRYRSDGGLDMRTTAGKLSGGGGGKRGCIWELISGFFMFIFYFYYYILFLAIRYCAIYKKVEFYIEKSVLITSIERK